MAAETTKFQVNFKTHKEGTLINLYADSIRDLETQITDIAMIATLIKTTEKELWTAPQGAVSAPPTIESVAAAFNATPVAAPAPQPVAVNANGAAHTCRHGEMAFRSGTSAKGPWKGYMCAAPKGATDKCETIWIR
jgi:hypothetical protein